LKQCTRCKSEKVETEFPKNRPHCKACARADHARYLAKKRAKTVVADPLEDVEITVDPIEVARSTRANEKAKRDLKTEHSALLDENESLHKRIAELVKMQKAPEIIVYDRAASERYDAIACAVASDWHIEEPVRKDSVHGLNEFSLDIARERSEAFFKNVLKLTDIMARDSKITTIYLAALGDFFSGWIHDELMANNSLAPGDAARHWRGLFAAGVDFLLRESPYLLEADFIPGNHGRMTHTMHFGNPTGTSLETFAYHSLAGRYENNPRVRFNVSQNAMVYRTFFEKFRMRLIHGYETKYNGGVGGLTIPLRKAIAQWNNPIRADLTVMGHYHTLFDGGDFLVNGSLVGYNLYAQAIKASYEPAQQAFFLVHGRHGGEKVLTAKVWLDK